MLQSIKLTKLALIYEKSSPVAHKVDEDETSGCAADAMTVGNQNYCCAR